MSRAVSAPREMIALKPPHGAPCTRCGLCCFVALCELSQRLFDLPADAGPCPALRGSIGAASCGLTELPDAKLAAAAALLINAGNGCDMLMNGEPRNAAHDAACAARDDANHTRLKKARALWRRATRATRPPTGDRRAPET